MQGLFRDFSVEEHVQNRKRGELHFCGRVSKGLPPEIFVYHNGQIKDNYSNSGW